MSLSRAPAACAVCHRAGGRACAACGAGCCVAPRDAPLFCVECDLWSATRPVRQASKVMFAPPVMILLGGIVFGTIAPLLGGLLGAVAVSLLTTGATFTAGVAVCRGIDGASRWLLGRHRQRALPAARVISDGQRS